MQQAHVFISGSVQGVGYRQFVKSSARKLGITGWVRNTPARQLPYGFRRVAGGEDGGVEAILQGEKAVIEKMIELCRKGPFLSEVKQIGFEWEEGGEEYKDFLIL
ncbi:acylphosphatase [Candidatus Gottesmanbacteria bacterium]|nr:acylphosphatase [Candidatus Gottesmanbacteria bacterium]